MTTHLVEESAVVMSSDKMSNDYSFSRKISCIHQKCQVTKLSNDYSFSGRFSCSHQKCQMTKCQMTIHLVGKSAVVMSSVIMSNNYPFMGWPRLVGSLKLQVSSAEYCDFCRALWQKRLII